MEGRKYMSMQDKIRNELHVKPSIDPKKEIEERVRFLKEYILKTKANGYVLGISGGQDSSLAGRLAQLAVEQLREEGHNVKFIAVRLPYGIQKDEEDAQNALSFIRADEEYTFNIAKSVDSVQEEYNKITKGEPLRDYHKGNVKARMRMIAQYVIGGQENLLVIGTDHAAEAVTGFYTKFGDGGADIVPLAGLTKRQGKALLQELGAEERIYLKVPTADLLDNKPQQADETELGITYDLLDDYLEGKTVPPEIAEKIEKRYVVTQHKREQPVIMYDEWWK